tara:strand:- start:3027 stop:3461 length:435 start_codon:yes stop_codon:yes gene_type:complete
MDMDINAMYKNIDQELSKILHVDLVKTISEYYCYKAEYNPVQIYNKVLASINMMGHDGYDSFGPESDLYDLYILYKLEGKKYVAFWHRENWFHGSEEDDLYYITKIMTFNDFMKGNYDEDAKIRFNKFLPRGKKLVMNDGFTLV